MNPGKKTKTNYTRKVFTEELLKTFSAKKTDLLFVLGSRNKII